MARIEYMIVHCSDSEWGDAALIGQWHKARGWPGIGYHRVILNGRPAKNHFDRSLDGRVQVGIRLDADQFIRGTEVGMHALGYNVRSVGICLIGRASFTVPQFTALAALYRELRYLYGIPVQNVLGHCETESGRQQGKTCPNFDMDGFRQRLRATIPGGA